MPYDLICSQGEEVEAKRSKVSTAQVQHLLTLNQPLLAIYIHNTLATTLYSILYPQNIGLQQLHVYRVFHNRFISIIILA